MNGQIAYIYIPPQGPGGRGVFRALGDGEVLATGETGVSSPAPNPRRWEAYGLVGAALASAVGVILSYKGYRAASAAFTVFAALTAASVGAARILGESQS